MVHSRDTNSIHAQVYHGGPAHLSGKIASGDYIEAVHNTPVISVEKAHELLNGPLGTLVEVLDD